MSVVRVQASAFDVGCDVTMQRYGFFEILELILHSCNGNHMYIYSVYFISGSFYFFQMFKSYRELVILTVQFAYRNMFSRFFTFNHYNWRSNQPWYIDRMFSYTVYVMKKIIISISIHILNSIYLQALFK